MSDYITFSIKHILFAKAKSGLETNNTLEKDDGTQLTKRGGELAFKHNVLVKNRDTIKKTFLCGSYHNKYELNVINT